MESGSNDKQIAQNLWNLKGLNKRYDFLEESEFNRGQFDTQKSIFINACVSAISKSENSIHLWLLKSLKQCMSGMEFTSNKRLDVLNDLGKHLSLGWDVKRL